MRGHWVRREGVAVRFGIKQAIKWAFAVASVTSALQVAAAEKPWPMARGKALTQAFSNQDFGDGVHFAYQFLDGGELRGMNMGKPATGSWRVTGSELCWRWAKPSGPEECYQVRQRGQAVRLYVEGQEVLSGNLTPLPSNQDEVKR